MSESKQNFKFQQHAPIGTKLLSWSRQVALLWLCLLTLFVGWTQHASASERSVFPNITGDTKELNNSLPYTLFLTSLNESFDPLTEINTYNFKMNSGYIGTYNRVNYYSYYRSLDFYVDDVKIGSLSSDVLRKIEDNVKNESSSNKNNLQIIKGNISKTTDVYISVYNDEYDFHNRNLYFSVAIERHWAFQKNHTLKVVGTLFVKGNVTTTLTISYAVSLNAPNNTGFPTSAGTLKRTGNKTITFTAPTLSNLKSKDSKGEFSWLWSVNLLKESGKNTEPYKYISDYAYKYATFDKLKTNSTGTFTADNYNPVTVYPCWEMYSERDYSATSLSYVQRYNKYYDGITVPGFPRPINLTAETYNAYSKEVKLSWSSEVADNDHKDTNGTWVILRKDGSSYKVLDEKSYSTNTFIDKGENGNTLEYNTRYDYYVVFQPNGWTVKKPEDAEGLTATANCTLKKTFSITKIQAVANDNSITISWEHSNIADASSSNPYIYYIDRSLDHENWTRVNTSDLKVTSSSTSKGSFEDKNGLNASTTYYYRVRFEKIQDQEDFVSSYVSAKMGGSSITSVTTSRGTYSNVVKVNWTVNQKGDGTSYFSVERRPLGSKNEEGWVEIYTTSGTAATYSYDDNTAQPGSFNEYRVTLSEKSDGKMAQSNSVVCDGFCMARGVVSGRVSFGSGTAVKDVSVIMRPSNSNGEKVQNFRSLMFNGAAGQGIKIDLTQDEIKKLFFNEKGYTVQLWVKPDDNLMTKTNSIYIIYDVKGTITLGLKKATNGYSLSYFIDGTSNDVPDIIIPANQWTQLSCSYANGKLNVYAIQSNDYKKIQQGSINKQLKLNTDGTANAFVVANSGSMNNSIRFAGNIDELRVFNYALSLDEIKKNWNHTLVGNEKGLQIYWPFDEGMETQTIAYDFSKQDGVANGNHGFLPTGVPSSFDIPAENQLSLMAYTDADGNYMIGGVPFSGDGTNYVLTPTLGTHHFKPGNLNRYFSLNSLVHSGVDFEDDSSFPVSGTVFYENTTVPVEDAYLYVDGVLASREGNPLTTNDKGEFVVDVPIGDHFITVKKSGHTFVNEGRYPSDKETENFNSTKTGLRFYDNTVVTVAGRVAGGDIERDKPLGLGQGVANIGKATITLSYNDERTKLNTASVERTFETLAGTATVSGDRDIVIKTDPETGEWVAKLLPLRYSTKSVVIDNNKDILFGSQSDIDATNPDLVYTDSVEVSKDKYEKFEYQASQKIIYKAPSTMTITENADGGFGMKEYKVKDSKDNVHTVKLYTVGDDGKVTYTYGHPIYRELDQYEYTISAFEQYENHDVNPAVISRVPLVDKEVTIKNNFSSKTAVVKETGEVSEEHSKNTVLKLDSAGTATYKFWAGYPNIQSPYTLGLSVSYENNGSQLSWDATDGSVANAGKGFYAVVLGGLPTGNNFVTSGPDEVLMVLRDPPGTNSQAVWSRGTTVTSTKTVSFEPHTNSSLTTTLHAGFDQSVAEGLGVMVIQDFEVTADASVGVELNTTVNTANTTTRTITTTEDITTGEGMDFVGAVGDVFIGSAKNIIFGACKSVDLYMDSNNQPYLDMKEAISTGEEFTTSFKYASNFIKETLIPNFVKIRNSVLLPKGTQVNRPKTGKPVYISKLEPNEAGYGSSNNDKKQWKTNALEIKDMKNGIYDGPSYKMILPEDYTKKCYQDTINYLNMQIASWENELAKNEKAKVEAIQNRDQYIIDNHSFDAGATISSSKTQEVTEGKTVNATQEANIVLGSELGATVSGIGVTVAINNSIGVTASEEVGNETTKSMTIGYTLAEDGDDDYLSIDVLRAPDDFGPIFYTRAGATSCPYEDEVVTEYYEPGTVISQATIQIEKPEIEVAAESLQLTGVPAGSKATMTVYIRNNSDTGEDCWFNLNVPDESNPDGLNVSLDGRNITNGRTILVPAGQTMVKTFTVEQTNPDVLEYKNVQLRISSTCQKDNTSTYAEIADTADFSVYFQPSCSEVKLASTHTLVNNDTKTPVTLSISGYNYSMRSLEGIILQYKSETDADFRNLQEYTKDEARLAADHNLLPLVALEGTKKLTYTIDLRDDAKFTDHTYTFRAITVCNQGNEKVNNESEEIVIVRDLSRPMLIAQPTPSSGILTNSDNLTITFNENIQSGILSKANNFSVVGVLNETEVAHEVAMSVTGVEPTAKTEATMDLSGKSFATSLWVNYSSNGTLLQHGTADNGFKVAIENGKLAVSVAGKKLTSDTSLPENKWLYLNVSLDAEAKILSAGYASDADTETLLNEYIATDYEGNGPVSLGGNNLVAKIQELSIWNDSRSMSEAQATMYTTKSQYTNGLMGYWQLNEGHGDVATDKARSRNLTLSSQNAWWIAGDNYALTLDGTKTVAASISALNTTSSDDYLVEAWFKADEQQNGVASVLSTEAMDLRLNESGDLEIALTNNGVETPAVAIQPSLNDGQWHHVAVNVLKSSNGSGIIYVDGQQRKQLAASAMPALYGSKLMLGAHKMPGFAAYDQQLKGAIDEVRIWKGRRTADVIKNNMYTRVKADESGLVAYYPMETLVRDDYNQIVTRESLNDAVESINALSFTDNVGGVVASAELSKDNTAALKTAPHQSDVEFNFVASERQITVQLTEQPYKLEGCNIYITARDVKDIHGNAAQPITWTVYVQKNTLKWQEKSLDITKEGYNNKTFTATIENSGAESEAWSLSGMPSWLTVNVDGGMLAPQSSQKLTFTVANSLPIGNYETAVYLTGSQNIDAPLFVSVSSEGEAPDWAAAPGANTMTVIGQLNINGVLSSDTRDMVAAFRGTECVGVAHPKYFSRYDSYVVMMSIYGDDEADLTYKAYDASTGIVYPSVSISNASAYKFVVDKSIGSFTQPVVFTPLNEIEQDLSMDRSGWKWFSLYAQPKNNNVSVVFKDAKDAIVTITDGEKSVINWLGDLVDFKLNKAYKLNATAPFKESFVGEPADAENVDITLNGNGWTWIGYPCQASNTLDAAFANAEPNEGDLVKNQSSFSVYTEGEWVGTLTALVPGDGYMYNRTVAGNKTFHFTKLTVNSRRNAPAKQQNSTAINNGFKDNMTMVAVVKNGDELIENAQVTVYANGEVRGTSTEAVKDGKHFLTIGGNASESELLTFVVATDNNVYYLNQTEMFHADAKIGTMSSPVVLQLGDITGIRSIDVMTNRGDYYDMQGRKVNNAHVKKGVYINNGQKMVVK